MKKYLLLGLSLIVAIVKNGLFILFQYLVISLGIDATYKSHINSSSSTSFGSEFINGYYYENNQKWLEDRNSQLDGLILYIIVISIFIGLVVLTVWTVTLILTLTKKEVPAGVLTIIFLSIVIGIIMLVTRERKPVTTVKNTPAPAPKTVSQKPEIKPKYQCDYCDRILDKFYVKCPHCGGDLKK